MPLFNKMKYFYKMSQKKAIVCPRKDYSKNMYSCYLLLKVKQQAYEPFTMPVF